jgi:tripartite-type tricarboxylate transporter receptor subunit TctC
MSLRNSTIMGGNMLLSRYAVTLLCFQLLLAAGVVSAQDFPAKPVRIVTSPAGGGNDFKSRLIAHGIAERLGQPVIVDNRATFATIETVMKAAPDGYTLLVQGGTVWIYPLLAKAPFDAVRDFSPITLVTSAASLVVVHPSLPVKSIKELIALARAKPGEINYGSGTSGTSAHLQTEMFKAMAGVNILRVPYKGGGPTLIGLFSGEVQLLIEGIGELGPHVNSGKVRGIAVTSLTPSPQFPNLPTVAASGVPGYEAVQLTGMWAPAKTPDAVVRRLNQEVVRVLGQPDARAKLFDTGGEAGRDTPEEFGARIKADIARWARVIKEAGISAE